MSGPPRMKSLNFTEPEARPVLGPTGNKARSVELQKPIVKSKCEMTQEVVDESKGKTCPEALQSPEMTSDKTTCPANFRKNGGMDLSTMRQRQPNLSSNASCSSDASCDSSHSWASTGRINRRGGIQSRTHSKKKEKCSPKPEKIEDNKGTATIGAETEAIDEAAAVKKRCAWVTSNTDPSYAAFHDEEWGFSIHDDKKLFELLCLSTALAELSWPVILNKRQIFRDVFLDFDPAAVSQINDKKIATLGTPAISLLSEVKLRTIIENARHICKIINEVGSFDKYIWGFVNYKPIINNFRYPRQVPIKTSKADTISKDMIRRGFRGIGPTVIYSFMQAAGITNDHLISCFRYHDCVIPGDLR